jgi:agmatine/peptidylarginine deiminase
MYYLALAGNLLAIAVGIYAIVNWINGKYVSNVVELKETPSNEVDGDIISVKGNYVNFLQLGKEIYLPSFGDNYDAEKYNSELLSKYGKVRTVPSNELAQFGGLLHCISFTN